MVTEATTKFAKPDLTDGPIEENADLLIALPILVTFTILAVVVIIVLSGVLIFSRLRSYKMAAAASSDAAHGRGDASSGAQFGFATTALNSLTLSSIAVPLPDKIKVC